MDIARRLREEALRSDHRRVLVLVGSPEATRERAVEAMEAADVDRSATASLGPVDAFGCAHHDDSNAASLLGRTLEAVVYDAHESLRPNALGQAVGAIAGGGLVVLLAPPLAEWPESRDDFDESLVVPPAELGDVTGNCRARLVETLRTHRGVAIVDAESGERHKSGTTNPGPRPPARRTDPPADTEFPRAAYEQCRTDDQMAAVEAMESLADPGGTVVVDADRGRGKSSAAGLAAGSLAADGADVLVTAPQYGRAAEVFARARALLDAMDALEGVDREDNPELLASAGRVRFAPPTAAAEMPGDPDAVVVDEAAALPVRLLVRFLDAPAVGFTTTIHGYEGAGRGFSVRFDDHLRESDRSVDRLTMTEPIRFAPGDPVEVWLTRALLLDARPAVDQLVTDAEAGTAEYVTLDPADLLADEHLLREVFGLLVLAHYRTEPNDLARLLDAPNVAVRALLSDGHVVSVALLAREGGLGADLRARMYEGERVRGNMLPDVLTTQLRDEAAGVPRGWRVLRIATHPAVRSRGLGAELLSAVESEATGTFDWVGVGYGATPPLVDFWAANGYVPVHLSTTRNDRSGEHSALMLRPLSAAGEALLDRHVEWFRDRLPSILAGALSGLDPDVVRAVLSALPTGSVPDLSGPAWRLLAGTPHGAGLFETAPEPFGRLALHALTDDGGPPLDARTERLLASRCLQRRPWGTVADHLGYPSERTCMQALGACIETLVEAYGPPTAREELGRFER